MEGLKNIMTYKINHTMTRNEDVISTIYIIHDPKM